jgi:hypothetical protein
MAAAGPAEAEAATAADPMGKVRARRGEEKGDGDRVNFFLPGRWFFFFENLDGGWWNAQSLHEYTIASQRRYMRAADGFTGLDHDQAYSFT